MRRRWTILIVGSMLATLPTFGIQGTAHAAAKGTSTTKTEIGTQGWPTGCHTGPLSNGSYAICSASNGGRYRALVICEDWFGQKVWRTPSWVSSGTSQVFCPPETERISYGLESRSY